MRLATVCVLLALLGPAASAIEVPLEVGQTPAQAYDALKHALGMDHRYLDLDSNVLRPWNVRDEVAFLLPENADPLALAVLRFCVKILRDGEPVPEDLPPGAKPRRVSFGETPVRVVEPRVTAQVAEGGLAEPAFGPLKERLLRRLLPLTLTPLSPAHASQILKNAYGIPPGSDDATIRRKVEERLRLANPSVQPADVDRVVERLKTIASGGAPTVAPDPMIDIQKIYAKVAAGTTTSAREIIDALSRDMADRYAGPNHAPTVGGDESSPGPDAPDSIDCTPALGWSF